MTPQAFEGNFTQQDPISEDAIASAIEILRSGRLHRYNTVDDLPSEASQLEREYADYQGSRYCLACASGGAAMQIALRAAQIQPDEPVLTNAFTLAPVPGAIASMGARPVLVEITDNMVLDLDDLEIKINQSESRVLLISHMRGHLVDMDRLMEIINAHNVTLIEDCAHTMGAKWNQQNSGNFGFAACFSTQTYKHINSGEGGLIVSDDPEFMARAIILSGSYMLYERHGAAPEPATFTDIRLDTPNCSARMDNLRATILRHQLANLDENIKRWNQRYRIIEQKLKQIRQLNVPVRPAQEYYVGSSIQFLIPGINANDAQQFTAANRELGVELKWFGGDEPVAFTSNHTSWRYMASQSMPESDAILGSMFDMRIPLTFSPQDCEQIGEIIAYCAHDLLS